MPASPKPFKTQRRGIAVFYVGSAAVNESLKMKELNRHLQINHSQHQGMSKEFLLLSFVSSLWLVYRQLATSR